MGAQEGLDLLLEAVRHIVYERQRRDVHFTLVGSGTELEKLRKLSSRLGLDGTVTFTGRLDDREFLEVLNTADVCVNPDVVNEMNDKSTMNKILEYMALGKPIVQFDSTEGKVSAGEASLYARANAPVDFAERILELLDDPQRRLAMGQLGRTRIERELSWQHQVPRLLAAYDAVFEGIRAGRRAGIDSGTATNVEPSGGGADASYGAPPPSVPKVNRAPRRER